ncbi:MAG: dihydroorotate dehydrogenase electron transfer subunit [Desulfobacterales bacterium]
MEFQKLRIISTTRIGSQYVKLTLACGAAYAEAAPGRFVMVRIPGNIDPLLSRPFSIHDIHVSESGPCALDILFKIIGKGTEKLARLKTGDRLEVLGPLGKGFTIPDSASTVYAAAGGIGIAPIPFLVKHLSTSGISKNGIVVFAGAGTKEDILCLETLSQMASHVHVTTDDGSFGEKGLVTGRLEKAVKTQPPDMVYACGPLDMLKTVARIASKYRVNGQISLEAMMACGLGACLGCAVKNSKHPDSYARVCVDGPVFDLSDFGF